MAVLIGQSHDFWRAYSLFVARVASFAPEREAHARAQMMLRGTQINYMADKSHAISNGNRTEWSPIRSVIIRVINKIGRPRSGSPICLITSMVTDRIGRHEVLLPINHNFNKLCNIIGYF